MILIVIGLAGGDAALAVPPPAPLLPVLVDVTLLPAESGNAWLPGTSPEGIPGIPAGPSAIAAPATNEHMAARHKAEPTATPASNARQRTPIIPGPLISDVRPKTPSSRGANFSKPLSKDTKPHQELLPRPAGAGTSRLRDQR